MTMTLTIIMNSHTFNTVLNKVQFDNTDEKYWPYLNSQNTPHTVFPPQMAI